MKVITVSQMRQLDEWAVSKIGIPRLLLMENAGRSVADTILREFGRIANAGVIAGKGFNGGDGLVAARHLKNAGSEVSVFLVGEREALKEEAKLNYDIAHMMGIEIWEIRDSADLSKFKDKIQHFDLILDALFGIGLSGPPAGIAAQIIETVNTTKIQTAKVVALDVPSGLNADSGEVLVPAIQADLTVTFHLPKIGLYKFPASQYTGKLIIADIGIPYETQKTEVLGARAPKADLKAEVTDLKFVENYLPRRKADVHKGSCGRVLVLAGSLGMSGAAILTARAGLRSGAGLVKLACPESLANVIDANTPEVITVPLPETFSKTLSLSAFKIIIRLIDQFDALIIGPGMSRDKETAKLVRKLIENPQINLPLVLDADGLNALTANLTVLKKRKFPTVITPHPGELSRLLNLSVSKIQSDRIKSAQLISREMNVITILKGFSSIISDGQNRIYLNPTGNPGMASAGVGDVLSGIIGSLIAQGCPVFEAAVISVFIHGMAGDVVSSLKGEHGLIASDLIEALPYVIGSIIKKK